MWYGLTEAEKERAIEEARSYLIDRARRGLGPVSYQDLYDHLTKAPSAMFRSVGQLLGEVGEREVAAGHPLISAMVLRAETRLPGDGFWGLLGDVGYDVSNKPVSWAMTLMQCYAYWHRVPQTTPPA
jgi:hypothetical protein